MYILHTHVHVHIHMYDINHMFATTCTCTCTCMFPKIDHGQDVSWLSELREVSVLFINLDPGKRTGPYEKQSLLQRSFDVVYPALTKFDGEFTSSCTCTCTCT